MIPFWLRDLLAWVGAGCTLSIVAMSLWVLWIEQGEKRRRRKAGQ